MTLIEENKKLLITLLRMSQKPYADTTKQKIFQAIESTRSCIRYLSSTQTQTEGHAFVQDRGFKRECKAS